MLRVPDGAEAEMIATSLPGDLHHYKDGTGACDNIAGAASCLRTSKRLRVIIFESLETVRAHVTFIKALWAQDAHLDLGEVNCEPRWN